MCLSFSKLNAYNFKTTIFVGYSQIHKISVHIIVFIILSQTVKQTNDNELTYTTDSQLVNRT